MVIKFHFSVFKMGLLRSEDNLNNHFELMGIKSIEKIQIYADNAKMYQSFEFIQTGKNKFTNLIESFNFQIRNKVSFLRRRSLTSLRTSYFVAKKIMSLNFKLMIFMNNYFCENYKFYKEL